MNRADENNKGGYKMADYESEKCPECHKLHVLLENNPCPKCGSVHNKATKTSGFTNWDDYGVYRLDCGNEDCKNTWQFSQEE